MVAFVICFGLLVVAFGLFFSWLALRHRDEGRDVFTWAMLNAASHIALGTMLIAAPFLPAAGRNAAGAVVVALLVAKTVARRRIRPGAQEPG